MVERLPSKQAVGSSILLTRFMEESATKRCSRCGQEKPMTEFARKRARDFQPYCRPCQSLYKKEHYRNHREEYLAAAKRRLHRMRAILRAAKDKPCVDCGVQYPYYVMDLDHREAEEKLGTFSALLRLSEPGLRREIEKCDVVCANCHRQRTHVRKQYTNKRRKATR
jgi:hypothetical protein